MKWNFVVYLILWIGKKVVPDFWGLVELPPWENRKVHFIVFELYNNWKETHTQKQRQMTRLQGLGFLSPIYAFEKITAYWGLFNSK